MTGHMVPARALEVLKGLEKAGFRVTTKGWMDRYGELRAEAKKRFIRELILFSG